METWTPDDIQDWPPDDIKVRKLPRRSAERRMSVGKPRGDEIPIELNLPSAKRRLSRDRDRAVDRRTRAYKAWAKHRAQLVESMKRQPTPAEEFLLDALADRLLDADLRRADLARGVLHKEADLRGAAGEIRRAMMSLGIVPRVNDGARLPAGDLSVMLNGKSA
jgi:hypothetical protein